MKTLITIQTMNKTEVYLKHIPDNNIYLDNNQTEFTLLTLYLHCTPVKDFWRKILHKSANSVQDFSNSASKRIHRQQLTRYLSRRRSQ